MSGHSSINMHACIPRDALRYRISHKTKLDNFTWKIYICTNKSSLCNAWLFPFLSSGGNASRRKLCAWGVSGIFYTGWSSGGTCLKCKWITCFPFPVGSFSTFHQWPFIMLSVALYRNEWIEFYGPQNPRDPIPTMYGYGCRLQGGCTFIYYLIRKMVFIPSVSTCSIICLKYLKKNIKKLFTL